MQRSMNFLNVERLEIGNAVAHNFKNYTPRSEREIIISQVLPDGGVTETRILLVSNGTNGALDLLAT